MNNPQELKEKELARSEAAVWMAKEYLEHVSAWARTTEYNAARTHVMEIFATEKDIAMAKVGLEKAVAELAKAKKEFK